MRRIDRGGRGLRQWRHVASVPFLATTLLAGTAAAATPQSYTVYNIPSDSFVPCQSTNPNQALNDAGQVCGSIFLSRQDGQHAFVYDSASGTLKDLGVPSGHVGAVPTAINATGQVTGLLLNADLTTGVFFHDGSTMNDLGNAGLSSADSFLINRPGQISGGLNQPDGTYRAYRYDAAGILTLANTKYSEPIDMNDSGQVAGSFWTDNPGAAAGRCFLYSGAGFMDISNLPTVAACAPTAINRSGQIAGWILTNDRKKHAFRYSNGTLADLGTLLSPYDNWSVAVGISAGGAVAGNSVSSTFSNLRAFFNDGTSMRELGTLGGASSRAVAMNANAQVVGDSMTASGASHAFTWSPSDNGLIDLNSLISNVGIVLDSAVAISDSGNILAQGNTGWVLLKPDAPLNSPPILGPIAANDPVPLGSPVIATVRFTDADAGDMHSAIWNFDIGTARGTIVEPNGATPGSATASFLFIASGVYKLSVKITDSGGKSSTVTGQAVVYDPNGGFVTGGGWIMSPPGAYKAQPNMSGRASFGFTSKYLKGANKPSGQTEFQFQAANLNFHSSDYDWLVVGGARAQYKGTGTINGSGSYKFLLTAIDGDLLAAGTPDRFRIRIWHHDDASNTDIVDYDNQIDSSTEGGNLEGTAIGGGSISIKTK